MSCEENSRFPLLKQCYQYTHLKIESSSFGWADSVFVEGFGDLASHLISRTLDLPLSLWLLVGLVQHLKTNLSCSLLGRPTLWYALICLRPPISLTDFLCKWIAYVNAAYSGFIARAQQHPPVTDKQEEREKSQFGYSEIRLLWGKLHLRAWACFSFSFISSCSSHTVYHLAFPPSHCSVFLCLFVLTFFLLL